MRILRTALGSLLLVAALGACTSEDDEPYQASIGTNERTERLDALGFAIVTDGEGNGRVELTLELDDGSTVDLLVPVEPQEGPYAEIEVVTPPDGDVTP